VEAQVEVNFRLLDGPPAPVPAPIQQAAQVGGYPAPSTALSNAPRLVSKVEPEYTEEARRAKYQGTVTLSARISPEGAVEDVRVVHALGLGLDEKAIEAVKKWTFQPATKDGRPVAALTTIEVNFRL
jgi:TonB family protein